MNKIVTGAAAGAAATVPMTWAMEVMHRVLPPQESHPLPPREITDRVAARAGVADNLGEEGRVWLALASHVGYGAAAGAAYAPLTRRLPLRPLLKGMAYGLAVWAGSYLGLLPALGILSLATRHPPRRTALMIAAHVVWGSALGIFADLLEKGSEGEHLRILGSQAPTGGSESEHARRAGIPGAVAAP